jgi:hypothetical protein
VLFKGIKKWSPPFRATTIHIQNEKADLTVDSLFGSSAMFALMKPTAFLPPSQGGFGFVEAFKHLSVNKTSNINAK